MTAQFVLEPLVALAVSVVLAVISLAIGIRLFRGVDEGLGRGEQTALAGLLGAGVLGTVVFVVGLWRFEPLTIFVVLGGLFAVCAKDAVAGLRVVLKEAVGQDRSQWTPGQAGAALFFVFLLTVMLMSALAKPVGTMEHDGIAYHLLDGHLWRSRGRVSIAPEDSRTAFPAVVETIFAVGMLFGNDRVPGTLGVLFAIATLIVVRGIAIRLGATRGAAYLALVLAASMPVGFATTPWSFVDVPFAGFALGAVRLGLLGESDSKMSLNLTGAFLGLTAATKYTGLMLLPITFTCLMVRYLHTGVDARSLLKRLAGAVMIAVGIAAPPYVRNWFIVGVPVYPAPPMVAQFFPEIIVSRELGKSFYKYARDIRGRGLGRGVIDFLLFPWRFTFHTAAFHGAGGIGLAPLAFVPPVLWVRRHDSLVKVLLLWLLLTTAAWFWTQQEARFLIPAVLPVAILAAMGAAWLASRFWTARAAVFLTVAISIGYGTAYLFRLHWPAARSVLSPRAAAVRLGQIPYREAFSYLNTQPDVSRVLILSPLPPPYFLERDYVKFAGPDGERPLELQKGLFSIPQVMKALGELQISHVFDVRDEHGFALSGSASLELVLETNDARVYRVR